MLLWLKIDNKPRFCNTESPCWTSIAGIRGFSGTTTYCGYAPLVKTIAAALLFIGL
jgi:hypothetical protein